MWNPLKTCLKESLIWNNKERKISQSFPSQHTEKLFQECFWCPEHFQFSFLLLANFILERIKKSRAIFFTEAKVLASKFCNVNQVHKTAFWVYLNLWKQIWCEIPSIWTERMPRSRSCWLLFWARIRSRSAASRGMLKVTRTLFQGSIFCTFNLSDS